MPTICLAAASAPSTPIRGTSASPGRGTKRAGGLIETSYGRAVSFSYDGAGNRLSFSWPDAQGIAYAFDAANFFEWVGIAGGAVGVGFGYDNLGRLAWNGRGTTQSNIGFDSADRVTSLAHALTSGAVTYGFGYSPASQVVTASTTNSSYDWTAPSSQTVNTVADGLNRDAATAAVGAPCATSGACYDCNGNLTRTPDGLYAYAYDGENRLTKKTVVATNASVITLAYDPLGRLWQTTAGGVVTQYLYDNDALVAQYDGAGNLLRRYVHGSGVDNPVIWFEGAALTTASASLLIADRQGSIIATTNAAGSVTNTYTYDPYGNPSSWSVPGFGYTGQLALSQAQLWHYKARAYDPGSGRFLQTDPIGQADDPNLYAYVGDDPTDKTDPTGTESYLIFRSVLGIGNHGFIVVTNSDGSVRARYSYGPQSNDSGHPGQLVEEQGNLSSKTTQGDRAAWSKGTDVTKVVDLNKIGFKDDAVVKSGNAVDKIAGTPDKPGPTKYNFWPDGKPGDANSNSGAARVLEGAKPGSTGSIPTPRGVTPGWRDSGQVGTSATPASHTCTGSRISTTNAC